MIFKKMNMKIGDIKKIVLIGLVAGIVIEKLISDKNFKSLNQKPSINQYLNRLSEFNVDKSLVDIQNQFIELIDFGLSPEGAFNIIQYNGESN